VGGGEKTNKQMNGWMNKNKVNYNDERIDEFQSLVGS
jgi:hypothetical protein